MHGSKPCVSLGTCMGARPLGSPITILPHQKLPPCRHGLLTSQTKLSSHKHATAEGTKLIENHKYSIVGCLHDCTSGLEMIRTYI